LEVRAVQEGEHQEEVAVLRVEMEQPILVVVVVV
jgi:hypothetical protein